MRINLEELKLRKRAESSIEVETPEEVFTIEAPQLWTDEIVALAMAGDNLALSKALLGGEEVYARFVAAGGSQAVMGLILQEVTGYELGK